MAVLSGKKGVYLPFFGSKFKLNFLTNFKRIFLHHVKELFSFNFPKKVSGLTDKRFSSYGCFKWQKRGIFALFWVKISN
jgi:hypothetical protein